MAGKRRTAQPPTHGHWAQWALPLLVGMSAGCTVPVHREPNTSPPIRKPDPGPIPASSAPTVRPAGAVVPAADSHPQGHPTDSTQPPFAGAAELSESALLREVLLRNPTVAQMAAAAQAAAARYPQVTSLEDPRFGASIGPASIGSRDVDTGYRLEVSQAIPFPGKLGLKGEAALNEAAAAGAEVDDTRLVLAEAARAALADYYLAARALEVNEESLKLLRELRENALARYRVGQGEQQDVLQADVTIARQQERTSLLERQRRVAQARINTLLNRPADEALPPPSKQFDPGVPLSEPAVLRELAVRQRPDVAAVRARVAAEEAAAALALREYYPDFEAMAAYDAFWQPRERDLRPMVGVRLNLPIQVGRRDAAVAEAQARVAQRRAELARLVAQVGFQVQEAYEQVREAERSLKLYTDTAVPKARENVNVARAAYSTGKVPFLNLIEAQRNLVELQDREYELRAEIRRRRAALDRATGTPAVPGVAAPVTPPKSPPEPPKPAPGPNPAAPAAPSPGSTGTGPSKK